METESYGPAIAQPLVRLFSRVRHDAEGHRYEGRALVHRAFGQKEAGAPQLYFAPAEPYSLQEGEAGKSKAAQAQKQGQIRRSSQLERPKLRAGEVLMGVSNVPVLSPKAKSQKT